MEGRAALQSKIMKLTGVIAVSAALALGASACGKSSDDGGSGGGKDVTIAFVGAQTGDNAQLGINISNGAKLAIDQYNATNPKTKVALKLYDTKGDPAVAPGQAQKAIQDKVTAIVGLPFSGESKAVDSNFEEAQIPSISPSATSAALGKNGWKFWHRIVSNDDVQGKVDADFITKTLAAKNVFVVDDNQEYSVGLADTVVSNLQASGIKPSRDKIDPKATDYSSTVNKVKSSGATALFYGGYYAEGGKLLKQLRDSGYTGKFVSDDGANDPKLISTAGPKQAEGALTSCACQSVNPSASNPAVAKFIQDYKAKFGADQGTYSAEGFDAANVFLNAIKAGKTKSVEINDYLKTVDYQGVSKPIKFTPNGEIEQSAIYMFEVKGGQLTFLGDATKVKP
jgi:branched-chain amino acid transport system substrate-binding protein